MKLSKEVKVGIIVTAGIVLLFWGMNFLKGRDFFTSQKLVYAVYDHVDGLAPSNPVSVNGMKIGLIKSLQLLPDHSGHIVVSMHVNNSVNIPRNSVAQIFNTDLLGGKGIRFLMGDSKDEMRNGDTLESDIMRSLSEEVSSQVAPLRNKTESLIASLDTVLNIMRVVFNEKTKDNLRASFASLSKSMVSIEHIAGNLDQEMSQEGRIRQMFRNMESISENLKANNESISNAIKNFSAISDTLAKANLASTIIQTREAVTQMSIFLEKVNKGKGSLGQLANNDSLYFNLNSSARNLDALLSDLKANPKKYVRFSVFGGGGSDKKKSTKPAH